MRLRVYFFVGSVANYFIDILWHMDISPCEDNLMNKILAREIAKNITTLELKEMFSNASQEIAYWERPSKVNPGLTIRDAFDILHTTTANHRLLVRTNAIREFGEYLGPGVSGLCGKGIYG